MQAQAQVDSWIWLDQFLPSLLVCRSWYVEMLYCCFPMSCEDNDPKHTSRLCKGYLTKKESDGVPRQMTWPPQSPDLNPIEMVWGELDCRVKAKGPTSAKHLWELLQDSWKTISGLSQIQVIQRSSQPPEASELHPAGTDWSPESNKPIRKISASEKASSLHSRGKYESSRGDWSGQSNFGVLETSERSQAGLPPDAHPSPASRLERRIGMSTGFILGQVSTTKLHSDTIR
ncbi:hypothetical protein MHYP_G00132010 [Metynnis hypsauchen]